MPTIADQPWDRLRRRTRREFFAWLAAGLVATVLFCVGLPYHDALPFAVMLLLPLVCLRQAWRADRLLRTAGDRLARLPQQHGEIFFLASQTGDPASPDGLRDAEPDVVKTGSPGPGW